MFEFFTFAPAPPPSSKFLTSHRNVHKGEGRMPQKHNHISPSEFLAHEKHFFTFCSLPH